MPGLVYAMLCISLKGIVGCQNIRGGSSDHFESVGCIVLYDRWMSAWYKRAYV